MAPVAWQPGGGGIPVYTKKEPSQPQIQRKGGKQVGEGKERIFEWLGVNIE